MTIRDRTAKEICYIGEQENIFWLFQHNAVPSIFQRKRIQYLRHESGDFVLHLLICIPQSFDLLHCVIKELFVFLRKQICNGRICDIRLAKLKRDLLQISPYILLSRLIF